jgi:NAD(P)H dehydrogenase (quinone)
MILVTGASGNLGRLVIESLLRRLPPAEVIAGARTPDKLRALAEQGVAVRPLDYNQPATVEAALRGADRVLLISGLEPNRVEQHRTVIQAARRAGVRQLAYTSGLHADRTKMLLLADHRATEEILRESGVPFTMLRNSWYVENYTQNAAPMLKSGKMFGAAGDGRVSVAPRADYAEAAAVVLTREGHAGKTYELGGDVAYTLAEIGAEIGRVAAKPIAYQDVSEAELAKLLIQAGLPEGYARALANADTGIKSGDLRTDSGDLQRLLGRPTTPLATAVERALSSRA